MMATMMPTMMKTASTATTGGSTPARLQLTSRVRPR